MSAFGVQVLQKARSNLLAICVAIVVPIALLLSQQVLWRPWISASNAAKYLILADGKGFTAWVPNAARFWGSKMYRPLSEITHGFNDLRHAVELMTLFEIIEADNRENVATVYLQLLNSKSIGARMVGLMAGETHGLPVVDSSSRKTEVISLVIEHAARGPFETNDALVRVALRVIAKAKIAGALPALRQYVLSGPHEFWTVVAACDALSQVPERKEAADMLAIAIRSGSVVPKEQCARALAAMADK